MTHFPLIDLAELRPDDAPRMHGIRKRQNAGEILEDDAMRDAAQSIIKEAIGLAEASGVRLPDDSAETALLKARSFPYEAKTSFQRDFERGKKDERDLFAGAMIRMAEELRVPIPKTREVCGILEKRKPGLAS